MPRITRRLQSYSANRLFIVRHIRVQRLLLIVTGPAKTGHVGTKYTPSFYKSYLSTEEVYFHSVTCIMMPIKRLLKAEICNSIA